MRILPLTLETLKEFKYGKFVKKLASSSDTETQKHAKELVQSWTEMLSSSNNSGQSTPIISVDSPMIEPMSPSIGSGSGALSSGSSLLRTRKRSESGSSSYAEQSENNTNNNVLKRSKLSHSVEAFETPQQPSLSSAIPLKSSVKDPSRKKPKRKVSFAQGPKLTQIKIFEIDEVTEYAFC